MNLFIIPRIILRLAAHITLQRFTAIMPDAFDKFLQTFANRDLQVLVNEESERRAKRPRSPATSPKQKARPAARVKVEVVDNDELSGADTPPPSPVEIEEQPPATLQQPCGKDMKDIVSKLEELTKKVHNQGRGGRNKLYFEILHLHGPEKAAPFWVPAVAGAAGSSSSSSSAAPKAVPPHPDFEPGWWATAPPPPPKSRPTWRPPPPPKAVAPSATTAVPKCPNAPWWNEEAPRQ